MVRIGSFALVAAVVGALSFAWLSAPSAGAPCIRKDFKTELVGQACAKGGRAAAQDAMKAFSKDRNIKSCTHCHATLAPDYDLKPTGLEQFVKLGGK